MTFRQSSQRMTMDEVGRYSIEHGKIVREGFFQSMG